MRLYFYNYRVVDSKIHKAAGPNLAKECTKIGGCKPGEAKLTRGWNLPAKCNITYLFALTFTSRRRCDSHRYSY
jgi:O-acetyl-ADP-ribose deacetylase (regulator of RNase III)